MFFLRSGRLLHPLTLEITPAYLGQQVGTRQCLGQRVAQISAGVGGGNHLVFSIKVAVESADFGMVAKRDETVRSSQ